MALIIVAWIWAVQKLSIRFHALTTVRGK